MDIPVLSGFKKKRIAGFSVNPEPHPDLQAAGRNHPCQKQHPVAHILRPGLLVLQFPVQPGRHALFVAIKDGCYIMGIQVRAHGHPHFAGCLGKGGKPLGCHRQRR